MPKRKAILLTLFVIAFLVRVIYSFSFGAEADRGALTPDARYARSISSGTEWLAKPLSPRAPGYPLFLAAVFAASGQSTSAAIVVQAFLGGLLALLLFSWGSRLGGRGLGVACSLWLAFYYNHVYISSVLVRDCLSAFLLILLVHILGLPFRKMRHSLYAGIAYGALLHTDPQFVWLLPVFLVYLFFSLSPHRTINLQYATLFLSFTIVVSLPWTVRNYLVYRQLVPFGLETLHYVAPVREKVPGKIAALAQGEGSIVSRSRLSRIAENALEFWRFVKVGPRTSGPERGWSRRHNLAGILSLGLLLPFFLFAAEEAVRRKHRQGLLYAGIVAAYFFVRLFMGGSEQARALVDPLIIVMGLYGAFRLIARRRQETPPS